MDIIIDGSLITTKQELFISLKSQINSNEFYGDNLDALWDVLSYYDEIEIQIINLDDLKNHLGNYADSLIQLFLDLKELNNKVNLKM